MYIDRVQHNSATSIRSPENSPKALYLHHHRLSAISHHQLLHLPFFSLVTATPNLHIPWLKPGHLNCYNTPLLRPFIKHTVTVSPRHSKPVSILSYNAFNIHPSPITRRRSKSKPTPPVSTNTIDPNRRCSAASLILLVIHATGSFATAASTQFRRNSHPFATCNSSSPSFDILILMNYWFYCYFCYNLHVASRWSSDVQVGGVVMWQTSAMWDFKLAMVKIYLILKRLLVKLVCKKHYWLISKIVKRLMRFLVVSSLIYYQTSRYNDIYLNFNIISLP